MRGTQPACLLFLWDWIGYVFRDDGLALPFDYDDGNAAAFIFASGNCLYVLPATAGGFRSGGAGFMIWTLYVYYVPAFLKRGVERLGFYSWISLIKNFFSPSVCAL